ncbi:hypothetical protein F5883DRAFT_530985 [Diaporthe sp. PMI_573]|nr:hypothetical protein F5883DRAFT_530985 [Diaporthaceae sp. PMI_573]
MSVSNLQDPSQIPSGMPPDGVTPNFIDPESVGYIPRVGIYVLLPLAIAALLCRIGTRAKLTRALGLDDVICIVATAITVAYCAIILPRLGSPLGRHQWDVPLSQATNSFVRDTFTSSVLSHLATMFIKLSILVFYLKIFKPVPWARIAIWIGLAAVLLFYTVLDIVLLALCVPNHGRTWLQSATHEWVAVSIQASLAAGWFGTIVDIYIIAIPVRLVSTLNLNRKHKFGVMAIFLTGLAACGCSAAGLAQRYKLSHDDITYNDTLVYMYSICEVNIAIICSCMPAFTAPIKVVATRLLSSWNLLKKHKEDLMSRAQGKDSGPPGLPGVPGANISGLRTFIRRFHRSTSQQTTLMADVSNFSKIESVDAEYHRQLRELHGAETNASSRPSAPGSRG